MDTIDTAQTYGAANTKTTTTGHYARFGADVTLCKRPKGDDNSPSALRLCRTCVRLAEEIEQAEQAPATAPAAEQTTYAIRGARTKMTGHYRRPGTREAYGSCGPVGAPNGQFATLAGFKLCTRCVKAETADRVAAEQVATAHDPDAPGLWERADVVFATVGKATRLHYTPRDGETLCHREVSTLVDLTQPGLDVNAICDPCYRAAERRAYALSLAAASPLARAAVALAATVEQADAEQHLDELATEEAAKFATVARAVDAVEHAEQVEAAVDTVEEAEALFAAQLVTEAEADAGTWRGAWIGEQTSTAAPALFPLDAEQGALFGDRAAAEGEAAAEAESEFAWHLTDGIGVIVAGTVKARSLYHATDAALDDLNATYDGAATAEFDMSGDTALIVTGPGQEPHDGTCHMLRVTEAA